jgi:hypothetical protein
MLTRINNKTVEGDGFCIAVPDIHTVVYTENQRVARVEIEGGISTGKVDWLVYAATLSGWHVEEGLEPMSQDEKEFVLQRMLNGLRVLEMAHRVV